MSRVKSGWRALTIDAPALGLGEGYPWSVKKQRLRGGRRDGVDLIVVDNGALRFSIVPTRGMGLWKGWYDGNRLGWDSPITDGPVHPSLVNLSAAGGLGWLDGFDELLGALRAREQWGAVRGQDGQGRRLRKPRHLRPARQDRQHPRLVRGRARRRRSPARDRRRRPRRGVAAVRPANPHGDPDHDRPRLEFPGRPRRVRQPQGTAGGDADPLPLELRPALSRCRRAVPRSDQDRHPARREGAARHLDQHDLYGAPEPGFSEQVYFYELHARSAGERQTLAMLRNHAGDKGVVLRFHNDQLPAFTLWKNTGGLRDGYVTGLEPGTNYPNPRPFEQARNRVVTAAGRRPLRRGDDPRSARHVRSCRRGRGRDQAAPGPGRGQGQSEAHRAVCSREA